MYLAAPALANDLGDGFSSGRLSIVATKRLRRRKDCLAVSSIPRTLGGGILSGIGVGRKEAADRRVVVVVVRRLPRPPPAWPAVG